MAAGDVKVGITSNNGLKCTKFDGTDDQVKITGNVDYNFGANNFTITGWINRRNNALNWVVMDRDNSIVKLGANASNQVRWAIRDSAAVLLDAVGSTSLSTNTWYHFAATRDGTTANVYINGVLEGTASNGSFASINMDDHFYFGCDISGTDTPAGFLNGCMRDVRIYSTALSAANILLLAQNKPIIIYPNNNIRLKGWFKLQDNYNDSSSYGNNATNTGSVQGIFDFIIGNAINTQRVGATDKWMITEGDMGQVYHAEIEEI